MACATRSLPLLTSNHISELRFLQFTCVLALYRENAEALSRSVSVFFEEVPALAKPGKKATEQARQDFIKAKKKHRAA